MALHNVSELFKLFPEEKRAIGAFNVHNMEYTQAVIKAAEIEKAPVILMIGEAMLSFAGLEMLTQICIFAARNSRVPVAVTLDHGKSMDNIKKCIDLGISVMFDGSKFSFEQNVELTRSVVEMAHHKGVSVEGELGCIGGSEDGEEISSTGMTEPELAARFVELTGVDALAVSIGNAHGFYKTKPNLDFERLAKIKELVKVPLVMHGGSDLPDEQARRVINLGMRKFNVGTELKQAFSYALKQVLNQDPMPIQPPAVLEPAREAVTALVCRKIKLFGGEGMATGFL